MGENNMVTITIDNKKIRAKEGANLLKTAWDNEIDIPGLCFHPKLTPTAACRLCVVKINGSEWPQPACTTMIEEGMEVVAFDEELEKHRLNLIDLMLSEHECNCVMCDSAGDCELQELGYRYEIMGISPKKFRKIYSNVTKKHHKLPILRHFAYDSDETREKYPKESGSYSGEPKDCIRCGYCVEACPNNLYPVLIMEAVKYDQQELLERLSPEDCIRCGLCSFVCPGRIKLPDFFHKEEKEVEKETEKETV